MIAGRPSGTALAVLRSLVVLGRDPHRRGKIPPDALQLRETFLRLVTPSSAERWMRWSGNAEFRRVLQVAESLFFAGLLNHFLQRKSTVEDMVRRSLSQGVRQVVNLGAGYDDLCVRLSRDFQQAHCFELDHPATQALKRRCLHTSGTANIPHLVPVDFTSNDFDAALRACPDYDARLITIFLAEGLTMYLDEAAVRRIFTTITSLGAPGSLICFTFIEHQSALGAPLLRLGLRLAGEPVRWTIRRDDLAAFLSTCGLRFEGISFPSGDTVVVREYLAVASRP